jgi:hypothetical protein
MWESAKSQKLVGGKNIALLTSGWGSSMQIEFLWHNKECFGKRNVLTFKLFNCYFVPFHEGN